MGVMLERDPTTSWIMEMRLVCYPIREVARPREHHKDGRGWIGTMMRYKNYMLIRDDYQILLYFYFIFLV